MFPIFFCSLPSVSLIYIVLLLDSQLLNYPMTSVGFLAISSVVSLLAILSLSLNLPKIWMDGCVSKKIIMDNHITDRESRYRDVVLAKNSPHTLDCTPTNMSIVEQLRIIDRPSSICRRCILSYFEQIRI